MENQSSFNVNFHKKIPAGLNVVGALAAPASLITGHEVSIVNTKVKVSLPAWAKMTLIGVSILVPVLAVLSFIALAVKFGMSKHMKEKEVIADIKGEKVDGFTQNKNEASVREAKKAKFNVFDVHFHKKLPAGLNVVSAIAAPITLAMGQTVEASGKKTFKMNSIGRVAIYGTMLFVLPLALICSVAAIAKAIMSRHMKEEEMLKNFSTAPGVEGVYHQNTPAKVEAPNLMPAIPTAIPAVVGTVKTAVAKSASALGFTSDNKSGGDLADAFPELINGFGFTDISAVF